MQRTSAQAWVREGQAFELTLVRQQRLRTLRVQPGGEAGFTRAWALTLRSEPAAAAAALRQGWLGA